MDELILSMLVDDIGAARQRQQVRKAQQPQDLSAPVSATIVTGRPAPYSTPSTILATVVSGGTSLVPGSIPTPFAVLLAHNQTTGDHGFGQGFTGGAVDAGEAGGSGSGESIVGPAASIGIGGSLGVSTVTGGTTVATIVSSTLANATLSEHELDLDTIRKVIICIVLLAVIFGTIVGNILVCVAVCLVRKLRRPCNYLLVSLAVSDLCVACLVMPPALMYEVLGEWNFGRVFCDIWVSFDVLSCTASILNLCAISVDRYWAITKPLEYGVKRTPRRMMLCVALVWLAAACISLPPLLILGNKHTIGEGSDQRPFCAVCEDVGYQIYATLGSFYIPLAVMLFVYYQIFRAARRIVKDEKRAQTRLENSLAVDKVSTTTQTTTTTTTTAMSLKPPDMIGSAMAAGAALGPGGGSPHQKKLRFQLAKERKASTTLGIIMSAFTICWLPFFILALVRPLMDDDYPTLSSFFLWLGYANSLLNPIIYATLNRDFRKPFQEILYFRCSNLNILMREDFYHSQYGEPGSQRFVLENEGQHTARESFL
ncbi:5-hydroxytryptamine receptor 1-like [Anopheles stephensi]|uniref:5-hydroxytryptamine receptor 1-like n=1 Tax=Anopheles stephensi TaxID=30069 RepID=UPI0007D257FD|nr:5-hydroxytryptamine receptor 1-like [Anopheles stephensi]XP_035899273.1 5-hydroxytryptamine receptor 1-like [Anopheles stephensi]XP_035899274.1 5-hydroxytryptamine receptor 1-like [Anopheles stephensi]XP_035899275.1 5-hydroxytryptamine receptor 1-like [Anopheles stephensi]XP_035899277.1 5-hydroxytryptamine receptor 1-like [Anopheles stephensi]XP_035899278.1 5-hydroxytryptamine receptor 1-like [Anopheles stephensi]